MFFHSSEIVTILFLNDINHQIQLWFYGGGGGGGGGKISPSSSQHSAISV